MNGRAHSTTLGGHEAEAVREGKRFSGVIDEKKRDLWPIKK